MFKKKYKVVEYVSHGDGSSAQRAIYAGFDQETASARLKDAVITAVDKISSGDDLKLGEGFEVTEFWVKTENAAVQTGARICLNDGSTTQIDIESEWVEVEAPKKPEDAQYSKKRKDGRNGRG